MNLRLFLCLILGLFIIFSFASLSLNPLLNDDAALYALAAKNAIVHNQWLAQFVSPGDATSFLDKPPLGIWLLAWIPKIAGINEITIHIPNVIYYLVLLLCLFLFLSKIASKKLAFYTTLIASTSLVLIVYSRTPKLDILLALFVMLANLFLYAYLKKEKPLWLYLFTLSLASGFLVKSGFGLILTALLFIFLFLFNAPARQKLLKTLFSRYALLNGALFITIVGGVLSLQSLSLKEQWLPYLKSISIQSKYNTSYLGFGLNFSSIGLLLITIFPWSPLFLSSIKFNPFRNLRLKSRFLKNKKLGTANLFAGSRLNLNTFCNLWFWSTFLFLFLFFRQTDLRTFTVLATPLAILAGIRIISFETRKKSRLVEFAWGIFFFLLFLIAFMVLLQKPYNADGFYLGDALFPVGLFVISLFSLLLYYLRPSARKLALCFALICTAYASLFYFTRPIADSFNPDVKWPAIIKEYRAKGYNFYIYRPHDRQLFFSPDLFYVDFMAGPADRYFWQKEELRKALPSNKAIVLSDTESWEKLAFNKNVVILARDNYSSLLEIN